MKNALYTKKYIISLIVFAFCLFADRLTKYLAVINLKDKADFVLIKNVLVLTYLENTGAAFSMLAGKRLIFIIITIVFSVIIFLFFLKIKPERRYSPLYICLTVILAGAVGNLIDRIMNGFVVDFIYFQIINFPVFNVADICVTLGVIFLIIFLLFKYRNTDFETKKVSDEEEVFDENNNEEPLDTAQAKDMTDV